MVVVSIDNVCSYFHLAEGCVVGLSDKTSDAFCRTDDINLHAGDIDILNLRLCSVSSSGLGSEKTCTGSVDIKHRILECDIVDASDKNTDKARHRLGVAEEVTDLMAASVKVDGHVIRACRVCRNPILITVQINVCFHLEEGRLAAL